MISHPVPASDRLIGCLDRLPARARRPCIATVRLARTTPKKKRETLLNLESLLIRAVCFLQGRSLRNKIIGGRRCPVVKMNTSWNRGAAAEEIGVRWLVA